MKYAIVGSRKRFGIDDKDRVFEIVRENEVTFVSGGCKRGADGFTEEAAELYGRTMEIHYPALQGLKQYKQMVDAYYSRNERLVLSLVKDYDVRWDDAHPSQPVFVKSGVDKCKLFAMVTPDRKGGTENTISWAKKYPDKIEIVLI